MNDSADIFNGIDKIIETIDKYRQEPLFSTELKRRNNNIVSESLTENKILETFTNLIAYSQNANSDLVEKIISSGIFSEIFSNFDINAVSQMNPCDLADKYWSKISGIRQQAKLFHIVTLARKIKLIGSMSTMLTKTEIPRQITSEDDIAQFWKGFAKLQKTLTAYKIPFFRSTTSLLHFLLDTGYDCIKPDLVVMKVAKKLGIVESDKGDQSLVRTVKTIQHYSIQRKIRPAAVDLYFLIEEGQLGAKKYVSPDFYKQSTPPIAPKPIPKRASPFNPIPNKIREKFYALFASNNLGAVLTREEIVDMLVDTFPGTNRSGILPSDYCYNITNIGIAKFEYHLFEYLGAAKYRVLGKDYPFVGPILWKGKKIGEWKKGSKKPTFYEAVGI